MNQIKKSPIQEKNLKQNDLDDLQEGQENDFEYEDEYEQEFDEIEKSNEIEEVREGLSHSKVNGKVGNLNYQLQGKQKNVRNKQTRNQPPSKENNWNQKQKVNTQVPHQQQYNRTEADNLTPSIPKQQTIDRQQQYSRALDHVGSEDQDLQQQQQQQPLVIQNQSPQQQSFTLLSTKPQVPSQHKTKKQPLPPPPQFSTEEFSHMIYENQKIIKQLKQKTVNYRQEIKNIGNLVDKDIQKSIVKITNNKNTKSVNIKQLFSEIAKHEHQSINLQNLREELFAIRNQSRGLKNEITSIEDKLNDPVTHQNSLKYQQIESKLKHLSSELGKKREEKQFATEQLQRMKLSLGLAEFQQFEKSIQRNQQTLSKLSTEIKEERSKIYKQQKNDIQLMQKLKYLIEANHKLETQISQSQKSIGEEKITDDELKKSIQQLLSEINSIFDERNTIQNDKSKLMKSLQAEIQSMESKNLQLLNQIRNIDASLLQFYTHKVQKKNSSLMRVPKTAEKLHETIDSGSPILREKHNQTTQDIILNDKNHNDKNMVSSGSVSMNKFRSKVQVKKNSVKQEEKDRISAIINTEEIKDEEKQEYIHEKNQRHEKLQQRSSVQKNAQKQKQKEEIVTESKTIFPFGDLKVDQKGAILSDEILGKVKIREINFFVDNKICYGVHCKYFNSEKPEIFGMKICEKNADEKCEKISLVLDTDEKQHISSINVGYSLRNEIKLIQITTSLHKSLKWSVQNQVTRTQTKSLKKYSSICIKAKLISAEDIPSTSKSLNELMIDRPKLKLAGLGFSVVELIKAFSK